MTPQPPDNNRRADVRIFADAGAVAQAAAAALADVIAHAIERRGRCALALSGGSTPVALYRVLAEQFGSVIAWPQVDVFWGDERFVAGTDPQSNYRLAMTELLDRVPVPEAHIHRIPTDLATPAASADAYAATLRAYFEPGTPRLDLILLGIGEDGHTASLFPHSPALAESDRIVTTAQAPDGKAWRVTLTTPVLTAAEMIFVLATGANKAPAIARALAPDTNPDDCPAAALQHATGRVTWWLDQAAAGGVSP